MVRRLIISLAFSLLATACQSQSTNTKNEDEDPDPSPPSERIFYSIEEFVMGVDLSYVNQILDHGGAYRDSGSVENPYKIFKDYGANVARLRLWYNPDWVREEVYDDPNVPLYSGLSDVTESIRKAKEQGMAVNLDFHYSDIWADPGTQNIPEAWVEITDLEVLKDSVYQYTKNTLKSLSDEGLMPEFVQVGNETNCGMMFSNAPDDFPKLNVCDGHWSNMGEVLNSGIQAVRDVSADSEADIKIILHIAQPENVNWWFTNITSQGGVSDFDIIGFSYYSPWSDVPLGEISDYVFNFRQSFGKEVMIVETAYSWTTQSADSYGNIFDHESQVEGYPATEEGQRDYMTALTREIISAGGKGVMYWEPAWISSDMKDLWGIGSSWENNTFFDFGGNVHKGIDYMTQEYEF